MAEGTPGGRGGGGKAGGSWTGRWIGFVSIIVPAARRTAWRREWEAEAEAARVGRSLPFRLALALGMVRDALAVRRWLPEDERGVGVLQGLAPELGRAARSLLRAPGFALAGVLTLGVGLAATAVIFTLVDSILLRPLPYPEAERVVRIYHTFTDPGSAGTDWPLARFAFASFEEELSSFELTGGYWSPADWTLTGDGAAERVVAVRATPTLLEVLGAEARAGRLFTLEDAPPGEDAPPAGVVLGHALWERRYGADPAVVGEEILVNGAPLTVLGVMDERVHLPEARVDLWVPYRVPPGTRPDDAFRIYVLARLAPGADLAGAEAEVQGLTRRFPEAAPWWSVYLDDLGLRSHVRPVRQEVVGNVEGALWILLGAVSIVLLIALANVANLFLVRAEGRRREVAVRTALGAGRAHLLTHFLAESALVSALAGGLALALAAAGVRVLLSMAPPSLPRLDELAVRAPTVALAVLLCAALAVVLGLYPWLRSRASADPGPVATRGVRGRGGRAEARFGDGLLVVQVALALVLLAGAALLLGSFERLRAVDPGFRPEGVLVAELGLGAAGYASGQEAEAFYRTLVERAEGLPGVRRAAVGASPLREVFGCSGLYVEGMVLREGELPPCVAMSFVGEGYWDVLGIPLVAGRGVEAGDATELPVVVASENLAERLWPEGDPLGGGVHPAPRSGPPWYRVVGVSGAVHGRGPAAPETEVLYFPIVNAPEGSEDLWFQSSTELLVATSPGRESELAPALRRLVEELDPNVTLEVRGPLEHELARTMVRTSFTLVLLGTAGVTALALGLVGLYGVVAYRVGSRRGEIGVRMALGASASSVRNMVLAQSLRLVLLGTALGILGALLLTRLLDSLLYEVEPGDPRMLALAAGTLLATAFVASWIPARRVTGVDPVEALRSE